MRPSTLIVASTRDTSQTGLSLASVSRELGISLCGLDKLTREQERRLLEMHVMRLRDQQIEKDSLVFQLSYELRAANMAKRELEAKVRGLEQTRSLRGVGRRLGGLLGGRRTERLSDPTQLRGSVKETEWQIAQDRANRHVTFWFVEAATVLEAKSKLPPFEELRRQKKLEEMPLELLGSYRGKYAREVCAVSHRWEAEAEPDATGEQFFAVRQYLRNNPSIKYVWYDLWCMPQGKRTVGQLARFDWLLSNVNLLFLGCSVLVLLDVSCENAHTPPSLGCHALCPDSDESAMPPSLSCRALCPDSDESDHFLNLRLTHARPTCAQTTRASGPRCRSVEPPMYCTRPPTCFFQTCFSTPKLLHPPAAPHLLPPICCPTVRGVAEHAARHVLRAGRAAGRSEADDDHEHTQRDEHRRGQAAGDVAGDVGGGGVRAALQA